MEKKGRGRGEGTSPLASTLEKGGKGISIIIANFRNSRKKRGGAREKRKKRKEGERECILVIISARLTDRKDKRKKTPPGGEKGEGEEGSGQLEIHTWMSISNVQPGRGRKKTKRKKERKGKKSRRGA